MFLIRLLRWLRGTVTFLIFGTFPERFINLALRKGLPLWDITPLPDAMQATTYAKQYKKIIPLAKKSRVKIRASKKRGLPFINWRYRKRVGLVAGLLFFALATMFLSTRIWMIEVSGIERLDQNEIVTQLGELGLNPGVARKRIDTTALEKKMLMQNSDIAFIAINLKNSKAEVQINERILPPEKITPPDRYANVVAACDGQIKYMEVYNGQPVVTLGDTVLTGDVIIRGLMEDKHQNTRLVFARAKVIARVYERLEVIVPVEQLVFLPFGDAVLRKTLKFEGFSIPLTFTPLPSCDKLDVACTKRVLSAKPSIVLEECIITPLRQESITLTEFEAKEQAMRQLADAETKLAAESIVSRNVEQQFDGTTYVIQELLIIEKDIAKTEEILINR